MPHFSARIQEKALDEATVPALIGELTEAVVSVFGDWARPVAAVDVFGVPEGRLGVGGLPTGENAPFVTLHMREGALRHPEVENAPARLIAAITEALAKVFGEQAGRRAVVEIVGVPAGRSGVGGEVV
ncbi:tautomerase family protein [Streptomyces hoynatensis]|uniref:4-oxalocrotonate tautomerase domain-containing protein n=1 Tax=Streptomyces hoynatensis TaxID=1141874 RepID=A0A3A9YKR7_9ACTN|nr:hypothetical protein [Streptomyces hoynatensis]RKN37178.1 hypothetical protein D7294_28575 [Streptomyces hoynatensis]